MISSVCRSNNSAFTHGFLQMRPAGTYHHAAYPVAQQMNAMDLDGPPRFTLPTNMTLLKPFGLNHNDTVTTLEFAIPQNIYQDLLMQWVASLCKYSSHLKFRSSFVENLLPLWLSLRMSMSLFWTTVFLNSGHKFWFPFVQRSISFFGFVHVRVMHELLWRSKTAISLFRSKLLV